MKSIHEIILTNLSNTLDDLGDYRPPDPKYRELLGAGVIMGSEVLKAVDEHHTGGDNERLNRDLISAAMFFLERWESWIKGLSAPDLKHRSSKIFHEFLLRYAKGIVKAWRGWRVDITYP